MGLPVGPFEMLPGHTRVDIFLASFKAFWYTWFQRGSLNTHEHHLIFFFGEGYRDCGVAGGREAMKFSELVRLLEQNGFKLVKQKGSIQYYGKEGVDKLIRIDYHGSKEIPTGTCHAILKAAGVKRKGGE